MLLFLNLGAPEFMVLLVVALLIIPFLGYKAGSVRTVGGGVGLLLSLLLSILGLFIVYSYPKKERLFK